MIVVVDNKKADDVFTAFQAEGEKPVRLGRVTARKDKGVVYKGHLGL